MATLSSLLGIATAGLQADQAALNVTANNVANSGTAGYVRQVVTFQDGAFFTLSDGVLKSATGPSITVTSARDLQLDRQVQAQQQAVSSSGALSAVYSQIQTVFGVTGTGSAAGSTAIGTALNGLFSSFTALASHPSDSATRQGVLTAASSLVSALNGAASQLTQLNITLGAQAVSTVAQINALTATVAALNLQISGASPNADAGTLEDQRQAVIAQLSQYVGLSQSTTQNNQITLTTTSGAALVSAGTAYGLKTGNVAGSTEVFDSQGNNVTAGLTGGTLGGTLQGIVTEIPATTAALDTFVYSLGTQINTQNEAGLDGNGNPGAAIFSLPATATGAAGAIAVIATDASAIAAAAVGQGTSGTANANALANLAQATTTAGETFDSFYAALISTVGTNAAAVTAQNTAQQTSLTQLTTQRDSISAVDTNEEAANLTTYQRAYQASAQVFSIADAIFADALNLGIESAVS